MESSDIVERLRERQQGMAEAIERLDSGEMDNGIMRVIRLESHDMYKSAADEITRLREEVEMLKSIIRIDRTLAGLVLKEEK